MSYNSSRRIQLNQVEQSFSLNDVKTTLFSNVSFNIEQGHSYAITGPSGAGKSSLLMLMAGLEQPSGGSVCCWEQDQAKDMSNMRQLVGFVFQQFHLLPELTALHNVALPLKLRGDKQANRKALAWLDNVGLSHRKNHKPAQLSGGEQQRIAIARALVFEPAFIFADEPTGNLDSNNADEIADVLFRCCEQQGAGLVVVTHSEVLAARAKHRIMLEKGRCEFAVVGGNS